MIPLTVACVVVPLLFVPTIDDVFYLPKIVALWVVLAAAAWAVALRRRAPVDAPRALVIALAAFVGPNLVAFALSTDRLQSLFGERLQHQGISTLLLYIALAVVSWLTVVDSRRLRHVCTAIAIGATAVSVYAIAQQAGLDPVWTDYLPGDRVFSTIGQPNALAAYLVLALPVTAAAIVSTASMAAISPERRALVHRAGAFAMTLMVVALVLTQSRGGIVAVLVALPPLAAAGLTYRRARPPSRRLLAAVGAAVVLSAAAVVLVVTMTGWRASTGNLSARNHADQWRVAARITSDHPLFGTGPETFPDQFPHYSRLVLPEERVRYFDQFRVESPHNLLLNIAAGAGVPAAIAFVVLAVVVGRALGRAMRASPPGSSERFTLAAIGCALLGHLVAQQFMTSEVTGTWLWWMLAGGALAAGHDAVLDRAKPQSPLC